MRSLPGCNFGLLGGLRFTAVPFFAALVLNGRERSLRVSRLAFAFWILRLTVGLVLVFAVAGLVVLAVAFFVTVFFLAGRAAVLTLVFRDFFFASRTSALMSSSFLIEVQPEMPIFLAILAKSLTVRSLRADAVVNVILLGSRARVSLCPDRQCVGFERHP